MMEGIGVWQVLWTMASILGMWPLRADTNTNLWTQQAVSEQNVLHDGD